MNGEKIRATVITGFLGSGKTTLAECMLFLGTPRDPLQTPLTVSLERGLPEIEMEDTPDGLIGAILDASV